MVIGGNPHLVHAILLTISAAMALWADILKLANKRNLEVQAALVDEFKVAWIGWFCLDQGLGLQRQFMPLDCLFPWGSILKGLTLSFLYKVGYFFCEKYKI